VGAPEPPPMSGQFLVEPELPVLELDDGVVVDEPGVEEFVLGLVATWIPARRALSIDPLILLREE